MNRIWFFDLDGTLADTDPDIRVSWKAALRDLGVECPNFDRDFIAGPTIEKMARKLLGEIATDAFCGQLRERFGYHYDNDGFPNTFEYPGVLEAVRRLKAQGDRVFIATNKRYAGASAMVRHFGWDQVFEKLYTGDMHKDDPSLGKMRKPELLKFIMAELGVKSEDCTMVGDTINDFEAAQKNHIASVAVGWGYGTESERAQATRLARTPEEI